MGTQLSSIAYRNFYNIVEENIDLNQPGITVVLGENGHGKTAMFLEGILFAAYGASLRYGERPGDLISLDEAGKYSTGLEVLKDGVAHLIVRSKGFDDLKDGVTLYDAAGVDLSHAKGKDTQLLIDRLLGRSMKSFRCELLFGSALTGFLSLPVEKQRDVINELLGVSEIDLAFDQTKKVLAELQTNLTTTSHLVNQLDSTIEGHNEAIKLAEADHAEWEKSEDARLKTVAAAQKKAKQDLKVATELAQAAETRYEEASKEYDRVDGIRGKYDECLEHASNELATLRQQIKEKQAAIASLEKGSCPTCQRAYPKDENADAAVSAHQADLKTLLAEKADVEETARLANVELDKLVLPDLRTISSNCTRASSEQQIKKQVLDSISTTRGTNPHAETLKSRKAQLDADVARSDKLKAEMVDLETEIADETTLKELFGPNGCRKFLINSAVPTLNRCAQEAANVMDTGMQIKFGLNRHGGVEVSLLNPYGSSRFKGLSTGQQRRVEVLVMFAIIGLSRAQSGTSMPQYFFDEAFEGLDEVGIIGVTKLLRTLGSVFVISHNPNVTSYLNPDRVWTVRNGKLST